jgi:hypothetical protein
MKKIFFYLLLTLYSFRVCAQSNSSPRIINIVNFIRELEPRDPAITKDVLYQTVVKQVELMKKYHLGGTFLLQYDALLDPRYQELLKSLPPDSFEVGAWWEIPQPLVENAGMKWRGRYPWDWRANIGFSTGYTPDQRKRLIDTYMGDFKKVFGYFPKSVASWFIDAYSLQYMYSKYHIVASANCKDQYGTDGYTLWGGYWNQAYYPSKFNAYMPAQGIANAIPVPIFRMLGSDPIRQYENGLGHTRQGVVTLEPVYPKAGGDSTWVNWFFKQFIQGAAGAFAYTQAGQENSFTWDPMAKGLELQFRLIENLRDRKEVRVETLGASGQWFKDHFKVTPVTTVTALEDLPGENRKSVWFDSRYYRANFFWEDGQLRIRDIHLFDEKLASKYETEVATSNDCEFFTLPVVDGYLWSDKNLLAGLRLKGIVDGRVVNLKGGIPVVSDKVKDQITIEWPLENVSGTVRIQLTEKEIAISIKRNKSLKWFFDFTAAEGKDLPFKAVLRHSLKAESMGVRYDIKSTSGYFEKNNKGFRLYPIRDSATLDFQIYK